MQHLEVSAAVRPLLWPLGVKWLKPRIFLTFRHYECGRSSALRTGRVYPRRNPWYSFLEF